MEDNKHITYTEKVWELSKQDRTCTNNCSDVCGECQILEPKQETLEEAAETISDFIKIESKSANESVGIMKGAKWQQERMYTEEDMKQSFIKGALTDLFNTWDISDEDMAIEKFQEWFKQFKKK